MMSTEELPTNFSEPVHIAVIGGTGLESLPGFTRVASLNVETPWGPSSSPIHILSHASQSSKTTYIAFLSRHSPTHAIAPHEVPNRANIAALRHIGVRCVIAFSACGSLAEEVKPRDFVVPDGLIDRTKGLRPFTFFEDGIVCHVPFADPFDKKVGDLIRRVGGNVLDGDAVQLHEKGCVVVIEGPQFSTRAESNLYRTWGGTLINMSAVPESKLAAEAELGYAMICMSTDYDCWHSASEDVSVEMVMGHMRANAENAKKFLAAVLEELGKDQNTDVVMAKHLEGGRKFGVSTKLEKAGDPGAEREGLRKVRWLFPGYFD